MLADAADEGGEAGQPVLLAPGVVGPLQGDDGCAARHLPHRLGGLAQLLGLLALPGGFCRDAGQHCGELIPRLGEAGQDLGDLAEGALGVGGEVAHLVGHDREAASLLTGASRLDGGVERQQVGLLGDVADDIDDGGHILHRAGQLGQGAAALVDGEAGLGGGRQHAPHQQLALAHGVFVVLGVLRYLGGDLVYLAGELIELLHHGVALIHRLLCGAGAVMDLLHLLHHLLQAGGDAGELPRLLLLILLQALDQAVVARDYVGQLVALAPRCQQLGLPCGIELQEGRPQSQQGPDQPAALHQGKQQGDHHQAERQGAEYGGELPVHGLAGGGEPLPQLLTGLQQLRYVLLHHLARQLLLLQRLAAALQLLGIALEQ